jgi:hypothetical protein
LPGRGYVEVHAPLGLKLTEDAAVPVQQLINKGATEPLGHELLREAIDVSRGNPRSAIVIGVAAAEVGFKRLVADLAPSATWLIQALESPPLVKMLKDYLPELPARNTLGGHVYGPPKYVRRLLTEAVAERNRVAHSGAGSVRGRVLTDILDAIRDLLYLFDYYAGQQWAVEMISAEFRQGLGT